MKKSWKIILVVFAVVLLGVGALAALVYYEYLYTKPLTEAELAELEVDWSVVTGGNWSPWVTGADGTQEWSPTKSFNDWLATVPEEDKAWADLVELQTKHRQFFVNEYLGYMPTHKVQWERLSPSLDSDEATEIYNRMIAALARPVMGCGLYNQSDPLEVAAAKKYGHEWADDAEPVKPEEEVEMSGVLLPALSNQKTANRFIMAYAARRLEKGDADEFIRACQVSFQSAKLAEEVPTLIGQLVKFALEMNVAQYIDWAIDQHADAFTDRQLAEFDSILAEPDAYTLRWRGEAMMFRDSIRRIADENGSLKKLALRKKARQIGSTSLGAATNLPVEQLHPSAQRMFYIQSEYLKRDIAIGENPNDLSLESGWDFYKMQQEHLGAFERLLLEILFPALSKSVNATLFDRRYTTAVRFSIAAHRYKLRHGEYAESSLDIDEDLLFFEPIDPMLGVWLGYELREDGLYIVPGNPEDEPGVILSPKQYKQTIEDDEPEYYDWELEGMTDEQIEEYKNQP